MVPIEKVNGSVVEERLKQILFSCDSSGGFLINGKDRRVLIMTLNEGSVHFL